MPTVGVLIPVPAPLGPALDDYRTRVEAVPTTPAHITLVPPTHVPGDAWAALLDLLHEVASRHRPFRVRLRGTGTFRPVSPVVFVVVVEGISSCEQLESALRVGPLASARRFPYHPHVTVAHGVGEAAMDRALAELAEVEATFEASSFTLFRQDEQGWTAVEELRLGGGPAR